MKRPTKPAKPARAAKKARPNASVTAHCAKDHTSNRPARSSHCPDSKLGIVIGMLRSNTGATIDALSKATGWQAHSIRGAISGAIKKQRGLIVTSEKVEGVRTYRISV